MEESFVESVKAKFRYLEKGYGFTVIASHEREAAPTYEGYVEYGSPTTIVGIVVDRGIVPSPTIGRAKDQDKFKDIGHLSLDLVYEYSSTTAAERGLLASREMGDLRRGLETIESRQRDLSRIIVADGPKERLWDVDARIEAYARLLAKYGEPFLLGDFSSWLDLHEYLWNWLVAGEMVSGRFSERGRGGGVTASEAEARFWRSREYIEALREEFGGK